LGGKSLREGVGGRVGGKTSEEAGYDQDPRALEKGVEGIRLREECKSVAGSEKI
jgi:hypothetical protein